MDVDGVVGGEKVMADEIMPVTLFCTPLVGRACDLRPNVGAGNARYLVRPKRRTSRC